MPYVGRDAQGAIVMVAAVANPAAGEWREASDPELRAFLAGVAPDAGGDLARSDQELIRVVEDLVDTLVEKNLIRFTDLPEAARQKLMHRRSLRRSMGGLDLLEGAGPGGQDIKL